MLRLSTIDANDMLMEAELDGRVFHIGLSWNEEGQLWTLSVQDLNRVIIASGIGVVPGWPLLRHVRRPEMPDGELAVDAVGKLDRQSFTAATANLYYLTVADLGTL